MTRVENRPVGHDFPRDFASFLAIVTHPAIRLGFLDAQAGRPLDHFNILDRIERETPKSALQAPTLFGAGRAAQAALAEYRYEEGRLLHLDKGLRCRSWAHPNYPPKQVLDYIRRNVGA